MGFDIKYPYITGRNDSEKIEQIRSYLIQLADELKWALNSVDGGGSSKTTDTTQTDAVTAQATFNAVKALIMNSNDIVNAYYNKLEKKLEENYDFVIETDTSGDWHYQKYFSGFVVAYGSFTANYMCSAADGNEFYAPCTFTLPEGMFGSILNIASSVVADGIRGITITSATNEAINAYIYSMKEDTEEIPIRIDLTVTGWINTAGGE